jgi:hypothetical protein
MALAYKRSCHAAKARQYLEAVAAFVTKHPAVIDSPELAVTVGVAYKELSEEQLKVGNGELAEQYLWAQCGILVSCIGSRVIAVTCTLELILGLTATTLCCLSRNA